jgi:hypothetical protein
MSLLLLLVSIEVVGAPDQTRTAIRVLTHLVDTRSGKLAFPKPFGPGSRAESEPYDRRYTCGLP